MTQTVNNVIVIVHTYEYQYTYTHTIIKSTLHETNRIPTYTNTLASYSIYSYKTNTKHAHTLTRLQNTVTLMSAIASTNYILHMYLFVKKVDNPASYRKICMTRVSMQLLLHLLYIRLIFNYE